MNPPLGVLERIANRMDVTIADFSSLEVATEYSSSLAETRSRNRAFPLQLRQALPLIKVMNRRSNEI